jgi:hypothetical protein
LLEVNALLFVKVINWGWWLCFLVVVSRLFEEYGIKCFAVQSYSLITTGFL